jgi:LacI family transcriptional regulator
MPNEKKNRVKLYDIAQASGVSLTAVSLALSDKPGISQGTREKVREVARAMGYRFKAAAFAAPRKTIRTIGLLVKSGPQDEPHSNHFYSHVIAGIESTCRQMGINLMFSTVPVDPENRPLDIPPIIGKNEVDGFLLTGIFVDDQLNCALAERDCPVVLVDSYSARQLYSAIISDNNLGAYQATEYLIQKGHHQIGFIGGHKTAYPSFRDRRMGYCRALEDHAIKQSNFADCYSSNRTEITTATIDLMQRTPGLTAIIGVNDETAINAMYALIEHGVRVPQEVSVIGFDDIYLAESVAPSLTTMRINKQSMGRMAVQMLVNQVYQTEGDYVTSVFSPTLIERNSVAQH